MSRIPISRAVWLVLQKDLRIELRTREILITTSLFAALVVIIMSLAFYVDPINAKSLGPGVLWTSIAFSGVLSMTRNWDREREFDAIRGLLLSPLPSAGIYIGKTLGVLIFLVCVEIVVLALVALFFQIDMYPICGPLLSIVTLGTLGFAATGTLFSSMIVRTKARDLMLTIVLFPLVAPALLSSTVATRELFSGAQFHEITGWIHLLIGFDVLALTLGIVLFDALISD